MPEYIEPEVVIACMRALGYRLSVTPEGHVRGKLCEGLTMPPEIYAFRESLRKQEPKVAALLRAEAAALRLDAPGLHAESVPAEVVLAAGSLLGCGFRLDGPVRFHRSTGLYDMRLCPERNK